jgi:RNA polymerase sigma-70 factor (ECF subfamily)
MSAPDDASLVRAGDPASLGALLERHRALLHAVAVGLLGHGPQAEDAVHDTFLIALRHIGGIRDPAAARGWLLAVLGNVCRAELRRPRAEPVAEPPSGTDHAPVEEAIDQAALRDWVWTALERLSEPLRLVVVLRHFTSVSSYEAIAEVCDVPVGTVRSRLSAARGKLAGELLETAAAAYADTEPHRRLAIDQGAAMTAFQRSGDHRVLRGLFAPDLSFRLADRVERRGLERYAARLAADFADGVTARPLRVIPGASLTVSELLLDSPPEQPLHCPPAVTFIHFHDGRTTRRVTTHYAARA